MKSYTLLLLVFSSSLFTLALSAEGLDPQPRQSIQTSKSSQKTSNTIKVFEHQIVIDYISPNNQDQIYIRYGFDGWNKISDGQDDQSVETIQNNKNYYKQVEMTQVDQESYQITIDRPEEAKVVHYAFCWQDCKSGQWDNNNDQDFAKTLNSFPFIGPYLSWGEKESTETSMQISWQNDVERSSRVKVWSSNDGVGQTYLIRRQQQNHLKLVSLRADTKYYYQIISGDQTSKVYSFDTLQPGQENLNFIVFGDAQDNGDNGYFDQLAKHMNDFTDIDFVLSVGDMPWNDMSAHWWYFFDSAKDLFGSKPLMSVIGNHDTPGNGSNRHFDQFARFFNYDFNWNKTFHVRDRTDKYSFYQFKVGPARFMMLNSERLNEWDHDKLQYNWFKDQLRDSESDSLWNFASWHIPSFNAGSRHFGRQYATRNMAKLASGKIDWVFNGHEHLYQRTKPIEVRSLSNIKTRSEYGTANGGGTGYIVVPPSGHTNSNKLKNHSRSQARLAYPKKNSGPKNFVGFSTVEIRKNQIKIITWALDISTNRLKEIDRISYQK